MIFKKKKLQIFCPKKQIVSEKLNFTFLSGM